MKLIKSFFAFIKKYSDEITLFFLSAFFFLVATNTQSGWLYFVVSFILGLLLFSVITAFINLSHIEASRSFPENVREGDMMEVVLRIKNNGSLPRFFLLLEDGFPSPEPDGKPSSVLFVQVMPGATERASYRVKPYRRGIYAFNHLTVKTSGFLGFFEVSRKIMLNSGELTVFPRLLDPGIIQLNDRSQMAGVGERTFSFNGRSHDFIGIRDYQPGHETRFIHWPSTARHNRLMIKEFSDISSTSLTVIIETKKEAVIGEGRDTTFEYMVRGASTLLNLNPYSRVNYNLLYSKDGLPSIHRNLNPIRGDRELAGIGPDGSVPVETLIAQGENCLENSRHLYIFKVLPFEDLNVLEKLVERKIRITVLFFDGGSFAFGDNPPGDGFYQYYRDNAEILRRMGVDVKVYRRDESFRDVLGERTGAFV